MKQAHGLFAALTLLFALGSTAHAGIVYDNGAGDQTGGVGVSIDVNVDDFSLSGNTLLTDAHITVLQDPAFSYEATPFTIQYIFMYDNGNLPGNYFAFGVAQNVTTVATGNSAFGLDEYIYNYDLQTPFTVPGGTYWFTMFFLTNEFVVWEKTSSLSGTPSVYESPRDFSVDGPWLSNGYDLAFSLTGVVPSPAPLVLMGLGLLGVALAKKRHA